MNEFDADALCQTHTTTRLLEALHSPRETAAWEALHERYRPVVLGLARRYGVRGADGEEVVQETFATFFRDYSDGKYRRERGRLGSWLRTIARHRVIDFLRQRRPHEKWRGESAIATAPDPDRWGDEWNEERERAILTRALQELRAAGNLKAETLQAFELYAVEERPVAEVATACGISESQVYVAKTRVTQKLRGMVERIGRLYDED